MALIRNMRSMILSSLKNENIRKRTIVSSYDYKKYNRIVKLDILTANDILDVLNETNKRTESRDVENEWYECTGCYDGMSLRCRVCEMKYYCKYEKGSCNE